MPEEWCDAVSDVLTMAMACTGFTVICGAVFVLAVLSLLWLTWLNLVTLPLLTFGCFYSIGKLVDWLD